MSMPSSSTLFSGQQSRTVECRVNGNDGSDTKDNMLSMNFSTPLRGPARAERINLMMNSHPAFEKSRMNQALLVRIQTTLRRMPGISANEAAEINNQLQEVGQVINEETSQLIEVMANQTVDQEEQEKVMARMSLDLKLAKAHADDNARTISNLKDELASANNKREQAEAETQKIMQDLRDLSVDFRDAQKKVDSQKSQPGGDNIIKNLENNIKHLEDQVNNRRSLWVMKHSDAESVARAAETLAGSIKGNDAVHKKLMSLRSESLSRDEPDRPQPSETSRPPMPPPVRPHVMQPSGNFNRPPTAGPPPKFGPLQVGPPRAPSAMPGNTRFQSAWGPPSTSRSASVGNSLTQTSPFGRPPPRKGGWQNQPRFRSGAPDYGYQENVPNRPRSAFGNRRDFYPSTPTTTPRSRFGRFQDFNSPGVAGHGVSPGPSNALAAPHATIGPLIQMSDRTVAAWRDRVNDFYATIRVFVEEHASLPNEGLSPMSNTSVWPILINAYAPLSENEASSYVEYHTRNPNSKACVVTRVMIDYAVANVWVPTAWSGVDAETSHALSQLEIEFDRTQGQSAFIRQPLLDRQSAILDSVMKRDNINMFYKTKVEEIAADLLTTLRPLMNRHSNSSDAYRDLEAVAESAWDLSSSMLTSRLTFDFRFPEIGSRFSAQSMMPIWPNMDPLELQSKHWRVAQVTTPVITVRNDTGTNISAHSVALADVFCMQ